MSNAVILEWATPDIDKKIMKMARISNPDNQHSEKIRLLYFCHEEGHVSPFQMANACFEINAPRDITRQILRHWSMHFHEMDAQEFSQRYADVSVLGEMVERECRMQDTKNRQNSLPCTEDLIADFWSDVQKEVWELAAGAYKEALDAGIAKEQARVLLPEGLTPSRIYLNGNMRNWIYYLKQRLHKSTQMEHRILAEGILPILREVAPVTMDAFFGEQV